MGSSSSDKNGGDDVDDSDDTNAVARSATPPPSSSSSGNRGSGGGGSGRTLLDAIDEFGLSLKPRAVKASAKMKLLGDDASKIRKLGYFAKSCALYALFILYRAYRGFFVIVPAVFREVYRKLEFAVEHPFDGDGDGDGDGGGTDQVARGGGSGSSTAAATATNASWKTRITVSVLASVVTLSYVAGGAIRVATKFFRRLGQTRGDFTSSFAAAADEQEMNESKIATKIAHQKMVGSGIGSVFDGEDVNRSGGSGDDGDDDDGPPLSSGLAP